MAPPHGGFGIVHAAEPKTPAVFSPFPNMTVAEILARVHANARPLRRPVQRRRPYRHSGLLGKVR